MLISRQNLILENSLEYSIPTLATSRWYLSDSSAMCPRLSTKCCSYDYSGYSSAMCPRISTKCCSYGFSFLKSGRLQILGLTSSKPLSSPKSASHPIKMKTTLPQHLTRSFGLANVPSTLRLSPVARALASYPVSTAFYA